MIYLLLLFLLVHCAISYYLCNKEILSPGFFCAGMYLLGTIVMFLKISDWKIHVNADTIFIIYIFLLSILFGDLLVSSLAQRHYAGSIYLNLSKTHLRLNNFSLFIFVVYEIIVLVLLFKETMSTAATSGWTGNFSNLLQYARISKNAYGVYANSYVIYASYAAEAMGLICIFAFINNTYNCKDTVKNNMKYLLPTVIYGCIAILSTGRTLLLRIFIFALISFLIMMYKETEWRRIRIRKILKVFIPILIGASILFYLTGRLTGKSIDREFLDYIAGYFSSGIAGLNQYMENPIRNTNGIFGENTLFGIYTILRKIINTIPVLSSPLEFISLPGGISTNIYTPIRRYYQDFGYAGIIIIGVFIGTMYKSFYNKMKTTSSQFRVLLFAYVFFPLVEIAIEERVFLDLLTLKTLLVVLFMYFVFKMLFLKEDWSEVE